MHRREVSAFVEEMKLRIPERIQELERYVRSTRGYGSWRANLSRESLRPIGSWLADVLVLRRLTQAERMPRVLRPLPKGVRYEDLPICAPYYIVDEACQGVLVDVGLYVGEALRKRSPKWQWRRSRAPKTDSDYNQPTLAFGDAVSGYLPFVSPRTIAEQTLDGECGENGFYEHFAIVREYEE